MAELGKKTLRKNGIRVVHMKKRPRNHDMALEFTGEQWLFTYI